MEQRERPPSPLLQFNDERTVDEDAQMEEKLFAHALAPEHLAPAIGGLSVEEDDSILDALGVGDMGDPFKEKPAFDADFEEIMRRFDEDDRQRTVVDGGRQDSKPITERDPDPHRAGEMRKDASQPAVLAYDAQTLLDVSGNGHDDEDELLQCIEDIPGP